MVAISFLVFTASLQHTIALMKTAVCPSTAFFDLLVNLRLHCAGQSRSSSLLSLIGSQMSQGSFRKQEGRYLANVLPIIHVIVLYQIWIVVIVFFLFTSAIVISAVVAINIVMQNEN